MEALLWYGVGFYSGGVVLALLGLGYAAWMQGAGGRGAALVGLVALIWPLMLVLLWMEAEE